MSTWSTIFAPVMAQGRQIREGQALLGQAIIDSIEKKHSLIGEAATGTGKSFAVLIPMINEIQKHKVTSRFFKCVVSTETIALQTQLAEKDLPFLSTLYPNFTYRKLMGRSNYLCFNAAKLSSRGNIEIANMVKKLETRASNLGDGERSDIERVLGKEVTPKEWEFLAGSSKFCGDNQCEKEECYGARARALALTADIVVVNHAILAVDIEMKMSAGGGAFADGILGPIDVLAVDEAHKLEDTLVDQWSKTLTDWELQDMVNSVMTGIDTAKSLISNSLIGDQALMATDGLQDVMNNTHNFYFRLAQRENVQWEKYETALSLKYLTGVTPELNALMTEFEEDNPIRLQKANDVLEKVITYLAAAKVEAAESYGFKGMRKINKGYRAAKELRETVQILIQAIQTKDGIVQQYGVYGAVVQGWRRQNGDRGMTLRLTPLDISARAKAIWKDVPTNILLSATLIDLTAQNFEYVKTSLGFPKGQELMVTTPFQMAQQQLVYMTKAQGEKFEDSQYNFEELLDLMKASQGRALVLFTSRKELDEASERLLQIQARDWSAFPYRILVQTKDVNKTKLAEEFKSDVSSVLLATKSFFTGFDAPGETVSLLAMVKWPNPRYTATCKQQISHWRSRGFPNWYAMQSLRDSMQGAGRLVRSTECKGVVAVLDFRVSDVTSKVYETAVIGVNALGSPVTQDINAVRNFVTA